MKRIALAISMLLAFCGFAKRPKHDMSRMTEAPTDGGKFYSFTMKDIDGKDKPLSDFKGKVCLLVNVASECGNTPQYTGLQATYKKLHDKGFEVLGFPANNFGGQEPGTEADIKKFCMVNYSITFPMFSKISVKGDDIHPLYKYLTTETDFQGTIGWNFGKYLVNRQGRTIAYFSPKTEVESPEVMEAIEAALGK